MADRYRIGPFVLDAEEHVLTRDGVPVGLGRRAAAVLAELVRAAPDYVPKARILESAWPGVVVEEGNLAVQVWSIRRALGLATDGDRWIETVPARGYRFVGPLSRVPHDDDATQTVARSNLPEALTSLIGRERELAELRVLLSRSRLLTLTGTGGVGKTRLAFSLAREAGGDFADGTRLVDVSALRDPDLVPQAAVTALGLQEQRGKDLTQTLIGHLEARHLLLVLDNAEQLLAACARLVEAILSRCARVSVIATSRERLGVPGELTYRVPSLTVPATRGEADPKELLGYASVRLFCERAQLHLPRFALDGHNAAAIATICRRLDGIPLAIELAAARVRAMAIADIETRLDQRFALLATPSHTLPPRQQTLRAAIDWSYELLGDAERRLFRALSVFGAGWSLEAAERVCPEAQNGEPNVLDLLTSLVDKSLVLVEELRGATRYRMLETVQHYADDRRGDARDDVDWQARHLAYFVTLGQEAERNLTGKDQQAWLDRLDTEHDNVRVALAHGCATDADAGLRLATAVSRFWLVRGFLSEGRSWLARLLAAGLDADKAMRAKAQNWAGVFAWKQGDYAAAKELYEQSVVLRRELGDRAGIGAVRNNQGLLAYEQGDYASARALHEESLAVDRELGDRWGVAVSLVHLAGLASMQGDHPSARALAEESLAIFRELGDKGHVANALRSVGGVYAQERDERAEACFRESLAICHELGDRPGIARALHGLGALARHAGDDAAPALLEESLAIARELGDKEGEAYTLHDLGKLAADRGDEATARRLHADSLRIYRDLGDRCGSASAIEALAGVALTQGDAMLATRLMGAMGRLREELGAPVPPREREAHAATLERSRHLFTGEDDFERAWREGRAMSLGDATAYALEGI